MKSKISSIAGYLIAVSGLLYLVYKGYILSDNLIISLIQILAFCLMIWARIVFKHRSFHLTSDTTKGGLVTNGPYRWFRHPIYSAVIYFGLACLLAFPKIDVFLAFISIACGLFIRMILEEKALRQSYPEYVEYSKKAKRIIPFIF
jgi:protein-S-isoprenylcysteine O-methyltransferase Ste14